MRTYRSFVQRALDGVRSLTPNRSRIASLALASGIAASTLVTALGPAVSVRADQSTEPAARLQVVITKIHINNDRYGWGSGDLSLSTQICPGGPEENPCEGHDGVQSRYEFDANSGRRRLPQSAVPGTGTGRELYGDATDALGVPMYAGRAYVLRLAMSEHDAWSTEQMGKVLSSLSADNNWAIGEYTKGSDVHSDGAPADRPDFVITYEVRRAPLPDFKVVSLETRVLDNGAQAICGLIENGGDWPSPETPMIERVNGAFFREYLVSALAAGQTTQACIGRSELPAQAHTLQFSIDEGRQVVEGDETNNAGTLMVSSAPPSATPTPMPSPEPKPTASPTGWNGSKADLTVRAIKIHDKMPDGKDDCTIGHNDVTVVVKNGGKGDAGSSTYA